MKRTSAILCTAIAIAVGWASAPSASAESYALLIGVNDYRSMAFRDLRFAEGDAQSVRDTLIRYMGVKEENTKILLGREATRRNVALAIKGWLTENANSPDDIVFFYFSGHGTYAIDDGDDEGDGRDELLCVWDSSPILDMTYVKDDDLNRWFAQIEATNKVVLLDCCHAGTGSKALYRGDNIIKEAGIDWHKIESASIDSRLRDERDIEDTLGREGIEVKTTAFPAAFTTITDSEDVIEFAACRADQVSLESARLKHGVFTYYFNEGVRGAGDENGDGAITLGELQAYVTASVKAKRFKQDPQLNGPNAKTLVVRPLAAGPPKPVEKPVAESPEPSPPAPPRDDPPVVAAAPASSAPEATAPAPGPEPAAAPPRPAPAPPATAPEPKPRPVEQSSRPDPKPEPVVEAPEPRPEPAVEAPKPEPKPEPAAVEPTPAAAQPEPAPEPVVAEPEPEPVVRPEPEPDPEPAVVAPSPPVPPLAPAVAPVKPRPEPLAPVLYPDRVLTVDGDTLTLNLGSSHGVVDNAVYHVYPASLVAGAGNRIASDLPSSGAIRVTRTWQGTSEATFADESFHAAVNDPVELYQRPMQADELVLRLTALRNQKGDELPAYRVLVNRLREELATLPFVRIAGPHDVADRVVLVFAEVGADGARHVHAQIADVNALEGVATVDYKAPEGDSWSAVAKAVTQELTPRFHAEFARKTLDALENPTSPMRARLTGPDAVAIGDSVQFSLRPNRACHLLLINVATDGNLYVLYPNGLEDARRLERDEAFSLPRDFNITVAEPAGIEVVKAIITSDPIALPATTDELRAMQLYQLPPEESAKFIQDLALKVLSQRPVVDWAVETLSFPVGEWDSDTSALSKEPMEEIILD